MNFVSRDVIEPILGRACDIYIFILRSNKVYIARDAVERTVRLVPTIVFVSH